MPDQRSLAFLLHLRSPWQVIRIDVDAAREEAHVLVDHGADRLRCPSCGDACPVADHAEERIWRHLDMWQARTFIHARMLRIHCPRHGILQVAIPWAEPISRYTTAFEERVRVAVQAGGMQASAGRLLRISRIDARDIVERAMVRVPERHRVEVGPGPGREGRAVRRGPGGAGTVTGTGASGRWLASASRPAWWASVCGWMRRVARIRGARVLGRCDPC